MYIFFDFIFRLRSIYRFLDIPIAIRLKYRMLNSFRVFLAILLFCFFLYLRNFYITSLFAFASIFSFVDHQNNTGLVADLHEQGIFGNWKSTVRTVDIFLSLLIFINFFFGTFAY